MPSAGGRVVPIASARSGAAGHKATAPGLSAGERGGSANDVADLLADKLDTRPGAAAALAVREQHTFDAHADRVLELFGSVLGAR